MLNKVDPQEYDFAILQSIYKDPDRVNQRAIARIVGLSLGMTNSIVKQLVRKGWLKISKVNNRNIQYLVSPQGIEEITRRSYRYFRRTIKNVVLYKERIEQLIRRAKRHGQVRVILIGQSDLDFVVEHACFKNEIEFSVSAGLETPRADGVLLLYGEGTSPGERTAETIPQVAYLRDVVVD